MAPNESTRWTKSRILQASEAIDYQLDSPGSIVVQTEDYYLVRLPDRLLSPTSGLAQAWISSARPFGDYAGEAEETVRKWGLHEIGWWIDVNTHAAVEESLIARGGEVCDAYQLLALELNDSWLDIGAPEHGITVSLVHDRPTFDDAVQVEIKGWNRPQVDASTIDDLYNEMLADLQTWSAYAVVAYLRGTPVAVGRTRLFGEVVRLSGAVTLPTSRGRGAYHAILNARLRIAREHGATLALTRARPATSAPILHRAGFADYNDERCYRLTL
jgi:GNAT superfamily N-acetyltransferase